MAQPVIRHSKTSHTKSRIQNLAGSFFQREFSAVVGKFLKDFDGDPFDLESLVTLRKMLRDEVRKALVERDDKVTHLLRTGEFTGKGHEPLIILLSILIHYQTDEHFRKVAGELFG